MNEGGFPGYNTGVVLLHLRHMRLLHHSHTLLHQALRAGRYMDFKGHLGDQVGVPCGVVWYGSIVWQYSMVDRIMVSYDIVWYDIV